ncbi:4-hydroxy-3-methylbut-2-enyl diphosphate reductase [bacterium]|nr:4-hydroxy-3-methylbut-2-enyl diphosphate reductase [bacterium]NSW96057.1 4-hydroxy-3-methylbut-2-enyl diphosphate reductase [bacterium]
MAIKIILADSAGVCFGVENAVSTAEKELLKNKKVYSYGPLIHNPQSIEKLEENGLEVINKIENKHGKIIIRAHGITIEEESKLGETGSELIDMTCPIVKRLQFAIKALTEDGYHVIIVGDENHPEIIGAKSYGKNNISIIKSVSEVDDLSNKFNRLGVVAQTTIPVENFWRVVDRLKTIDELDLKVIDTLCDDIHNKQVEAKEIAKDVDVMIIIGGKNSSNTKEIAKICKKVNPLTYQVETYDQLRQLKIDFKNKTVGISAGASTPPWIIKETIDELMMVN